MNPSRFHSVLLEEESCKGCTICVTTCPVQAIRVRDGKACILQERCIDCGECIRRCPNQAKKARSDNFTEFQRNLPREDFFQYRVALPAPSLYGQVPSKYTIKEIHEALLSMGFNYVFPVAAATPGITAATRFILDSRESLRLGNPVISASCPTIIKFISIRFPTLLKNISPVIAPAELAAKLAVRKIEDTEGRKIPREKIGLYFISPCPGKITETLSPMSGNKPIVDGVFSMKDIHLQLLSALKKNAAGGAEKTETSGERESGQTRIFQDEIAWGRAGGEAEAAVSGKRYSRISVDGLIQCEKILESVEDGKLENIDFLELTACPGGCTGGVLAVENPAIAEYTIRSRESEMESTPEDLGDTQFHSEKPVRKEEIEPRPALLLDTNFQKAAAMMEEMEEIHSQLPGLDCGCCGAPNCMALAEDIVRGTAKKTDCIIILKEQYKELLENGRGKE